MIYLDQPTTDLEDAVAVSQAVKDGNISTASELVEKFEDALSKYFGQCVACMNSGTSALHLALLGLGISGGCKVLAPATTYVATANAIWQAGGEPVFVDVDPDTWCIDFSQIDIAKIGAVAILPVDLYGNPAQSIPCFGSPQVVIDAAESIGAGRGVVERNTRVYSFNGNKTITVGGGGCIVGDINPNNYKRSSTQFKHPHKGEWQHYDRGFNYRMTGLSAALGLSQLKRLDDIVETKRRHNRIYRDRLGDLIKFQEATPGTNPSWWFTAGLLPEGIDAETFQGDLLVNEIPTRRVFRPLHKVHAYKTDQTLPVSEMLFDRGLCFPSHIYNSDETVEGICDTIRRLLRG